MGIFNETLAGLISLLIVILGGYGTPQDITTEASVNVAAQEERSHSGLIDDLRESLIKFESRIREDDGAKSHESGDKEGDSSEELNGGGDDSDDDGSGTALERSRGEDDEDEGDDEDENDDDNGSRSSGTASSSTGTSGGASGAATGGASAQASFTLAEVAKHNTSASCYSAINGSVYDLTQWIGQHPGGQAAIKSLCGVDGSSAFNGQHGASSKPNNVLSGFKIGTLK